MNTEELEQVKTAYRDITCTLRKQGITGRVTIQYATTTSVTA